MAEWASEVYSIYLGSSSAGCTVFDLQLGMVPGLQADVDTPQGCHNFLNPGLGVYMHALN